MASPYLTAGAGSGSSPYLSASGSGGAAAPAAHHGGGLLSHLGPVGDVVEHLGSDVKNAIVGIPEGVVQTVEHPVGTAKAMAKSYEQTYSPLFHGDVRAFLHNVGEHPLGPLLDLVTLITLGGAGAGRLGLGASDALRRIELRGPAALEGIDDGNVVLGKTLSRNNPVIRARQEAVDKALKRLPSGTPIVGELARFGREVRRGAVRDEAGRRLVIGDFAHAMSELSKPERDALGLIARVPLEKDLGAWRAMLAHHAANGVPDAGAALKIVDDPKVRELYANPSEKMLAAHTELAKLGGHQADLLSQYGALTPDLAEQARYRHMRLARGAKTYTVGSAKKASRDIDRQLRRLRKQQDTIGQAAARLRRRGTPELRELRRGATATASQASRKVGTSHRLEQASGKLDEIRSKLDDTNSRLERLMSGQLTSQEMLDAGLTPGKHTDALRLRLIGRYHDQASQLAHRYESAFNDVVRREQLDAKLPTREELSTRQLGELEQLHAVRRDIASRLVAGRRELDRFDALETKLEEQGAEIKPGIVGGPSVEELKAEIAASGRPEPLYVPDVPQATIGKKGVRKGAAGKNVAAAAQSTVHRSQGTLFLLGKLAIDPSVLSTDYLKTVRHAYYRDLHDQLLEAAIPVQFRRGMHPELPKGYVWIKRRNEKISYLDNLQGESPFTSKKIEDASVELAQRYMVPEKLANQLSADFKHSSDVMRRVFDNPTTVWRALTLNLSVRWLTNNLIGNHLLYAIKHAGPAGLRAYLDAVRTSKGSAAARSLLKIHGSADALGAKDIAELFPEHSSAGTFLGTQNVQLEGRVGEAVRKGTKPLRGISQANQATEGALRRAAVNAELRKSPEVRARLKAMPKETRSFAEAARQELESNPALSRQVSDEVNATLGDFLNMSPAMRHYVRGLLPFVAWYRAILQIGFKLPLDNPLRANILSRLGQIGEEASNDSLGPLPSYLDGSIPLGGDRLLKTQGVNPIATIPQLAPGVGALLAGHPGDAATGELASNLNPLIQAGIEQVSGRDVFTGAPMHTPGWAPGVLGGIAENVGAGLPQVRLAETAINGPRPSKLYKPSAVDEALAFLGIPTRTINRDQAAKLAGAGK